MIFLLFKLLLCGTTVWLGGVTLWSLVIPVLHTSVFDWINVWTDPGKVFPRRPLA